MRHVLALVLALAACDDKPPPAPVVAPLPPPPQQEDAPREAPGAGLAAELASEVDKARVRCKGVEGIDRAPDLDATVTGAWIGEYRYDAAGSDPVVMDATFTASGGQLSGRTTEPNTFAAVGLSELPAEVAGDVFVGGRLAFMKTYAAGDVDHSVLYLGQLDDRGQEITGRWRTRAVTGTFTLTRAGLVR